MRWLGKVKAGSASDVLTGFEDWLPTIHELTGAKTDLPKGIDGVSLAPVLLGKTKPGEGGRDFLYREFPAYGGQQSLISMAASGWRSGRTSCRSAKRAFRTLGRTQGPRWFG